MDVLLESIADPDFSFPGTVRWRVGLKASGDVGVDDIRTIIQTGIDQVSAERQAAFSAELRQANLNQALKDLTELRQRIVRLQGER